MSMPFTGPTALCFSLSLLAIMHDTQLASSDIGDTASSHPSSQSAHGDTPSSHPSSHSAHGDTTSSHPSSHNAHGDTPSSQPSSHSAHGDTPSSHPSSHSAHGDTPFSHPSSQSAHGDTPSSHPSSHSAHGDTPSSHPSSHSAHGDTPFSHPSSHSAHGDTPFSHPSSHSAHGDTPSSQPSSQSAHGDTTFSHPSSQSAHGDTPSSHPSSHSAHVDTTSSPHQSSSSSHGDTTSSHLSASGAIGDTTFSRYPSSSSDIENKPSTHISASNDIGDTTSSPHTSSSSNHGDTTSTHPSASSDQRVTMSRHPTASSDHGNTLYSHPSALLQRVSPPKVFSEDLDAASKGAFTTDTTSSSHRTTETPTVVSRGVENVRNSIVLDTAAMKRCLLEQAVKEFWIDSDPLSLQAENVIVDVQGLDTSQVLLASSLSQRYMCQVRVNAPAGRTMAVHVTNIDCDLGQNRLASISWSRERDGPGSSSPHPQRVMEGFRSYCQQPLETLTLYASPGTRANLIFSLALSRPVERVTFLINFTILPDVSRVLSVEYTTRLNGSVSTPGWDGETSFLLVMDTWVSVAVPEGHEVMVSVVQLGRPQFYDVWNRVCIPTDFSLALYEHPDADPLRVYCIRDIEPPVAFNFSSGHTMFRFVSTQRSTGFKLHFSFVPHSARLVQFRDGTWNCSVPNWWQELRHHFPCNYQSECAGGEDEALCPYTTDHCGGAGRVDIAGYCYVYIAAERNESESPSALPRMSWNMAEERCKREGGHLASLNSYREMLAVVDFVHSIDPGMIVFVGLVPSGSSLPLFYRNPRVYLDGTVAHLAGSVKEDEEFLCLQWEASTSPDGVKQDGAMLYAESMIGVNRNSRCPSAVALCEVPAASEPAHHTQHDGDGRGGVADPPAHPLLPAVNLTFRHVIRSVLCPQGHRTQAFLACDATSACFSTSGAFVTSGSCEPPWMAPPPPSLTCDNQVQTVPYTLVCDRRPDCFDRSDEDFCAFPPCDFTKELECSDKTCQPSDAVCDKVQDCPDGSDEQDCYSGDVKSFAPSPPAVLNFDGYQTLFSDLVPDREANGTKEANRTRARHTPTCPDTHFQCAANDYCMPVFIRCNGVYDCPGHEDEAGCDSYTCPGFYRCRGSKICLHEDDMCDGIFQCPQGDDERFCNLECPVGCTCYGLAFFCPASTPVDLYPELRYLDARNSGMNMADVKNNSWLVYLSLAHCGVRDWARLILSNLRSLDLIHNNVTVLSAEVLQQLPNLRHLTLAHNPLTSFVSHSMTSSSAFYHDRLRFLDVSGMLLKDVSVLNVFPRLLSLNLSGYGINRLPQDGFQHLTLLRVLDLRGCSLDFIPRAVFQGLDDLAAVYTDNYKLCCPATLPAGFNPVNCEAPTNEVSSCESLLRTNGFRICLCAFAILSCAGNMFSLIFRIVSSKSKFKTGFDIFVVNLCVSDFIMGVYLAVIGVADHMYLGTYLWKDLTWRHSTACTVAGFLALLSNQVSAFTISLITLDRFLVLRFPFRQLRFTRSTALLASGVGWVIGLAMATVPLLPWTSHWEFYSQVAICIPLPITRQVFHGHDYAFSVMIVLNCILFVFIAVGQFLIYMSVQTHKMPSSGDASTALNKDRALARRLITVAASDFLCWFPIGLMAIMAANGFPVPGQVNVAMAVFVMPLNSAVNPFLYTLNIVLEKRRLLRERRLQQWMLAQVQCRTAHGGSSDVSADEFSAEKARCQLSLWLRKGILSRANVLVCLEKAPPVSTRPK